MKTISKADWDRLADDEKCIGADGLPRIILTDVGSRTRLITVQIIDEPPFMAPTPVEVEADVDVLGRFIVDVSGAYLEATLHSDRDETPHNIEYIRRAINGYETLIGALMHIESLADQNQNYRSIAYKAQASARDALAQVHKL